MTLNDDSKTMRAITRRVSLPRWLMAKAVGSLWAPFYVSGAGGLRLESVPIPPLPGDDWVRCKTRLGGICGTDLNIVFLQQHPATMLRNFTRWPAMLGHENAAEIVEVGDAVEDVRIGDRVVVDPPLACRARKIEPPCPTCRSGRPSICENLDRGEFPATLGLGYNDITGGTWSEYFVAHVSQLHAIPDALTDEQAVFVDPLACALHAILVDPPTAGEKVLVFASGIIALSIVALLRALSMDVRLTITVRHEFQARLAERLGADRIVPWRRDRYRSFEELAGTSGARARRGHVGIHYLQGGFDRLYDCGGTCSGFAEASRLLRPGGTLVMVGTPQLGLTDLTCIWFRELRVIGVTGRAEHVLPGETTAKHNYEHVFDLLARRRIDVAPFDLRLYRQDHYRRALLDLRRRGETGVIKAAFDFR